MTKKKTTTKKTSKKKVSKVTKAPKIIEAVNEPDRPIDAADESNYEDPDQMTIDEEIANKMPGGIIEYEPEASPTISSIHGELDDELDDDDDDPRIIEADEQRDREKDRKAEEAEKKIESDFALELHRSRVRKSVAGAAIRSISNAMYSSAMVSLIAAECCDDGAETKAAIRAIVGPIVSDLELELGQ